MDGKEAVNYLLDFREKCQLMYFLSHHKNSLDCKGPVSITPYSVETMKLLLKVVMDTNTFYRPSSHAPEPPYSSL